ncbi:DUF4942 domain-containing protein [Paracoccus aeridis]|uniref:DUF4942 domain-containing protein n=1 Tax=Paracoccus aeridis TaxID=1966466 RepID=UPI0010AA2C2E|nr:DUF4942 domain-containing protein [Paracoccus aeridis]
MTMHDRTTPTVGGVLTAPANLRAICAARAAALEQIGRAAQALRAAFDLSTAATATAKAAHGGWHSPRTDRREEADRDRLFPGDFDPADSIEAFRRDLDAAIWTRLLDESGLRRIMDAQERDDMDRALRGDVPPATIENISATVERLLGDSELIFRRGIARAFAALDRRFKSHDGFKIGSRIILNHVFSDYGGFSYGSIRQTLYDIERAFALLDHAPDRAGELESALARDRAGSWGPRQSEVETSYFRARGFKNGNAHLWLTRDDLVEKVNKELATYYGAALADAAPDNARPEDYKPTGTAVARDLAFYPTPAAAVDELMDRLHFAPGARVLEPSAGIGNIVRAALARGTQVDAVEIHPGRADALLGIGHPDLHVACTNFLTMRPDPVYDLVLMNPPFAGIHWMQHVRLAFDFLKPGGELRAILPASAEVNETPAHIRFRAWAECHRPGWRGLWRDLPPESFAEVGTRIATVILTLRKPKA